MHKSVLRSYLIIIADTPLEYPRSFILGVKKNLQGGKGKGIRGGKEKKLGKKLKEKKGRNGKEKKKEKRKPGELNRRGASISLKSPMLYPSPTVTLQLHCEQFWTFIVTVTIMTVMILTGAMAELTFCAINWEEQQLAMNLHATMNVVSVHGLF